MSARTHSELTIDDRILMVKAAIARITNANAEWYAAETNPASTSVQRWVKKRTLDAMEAEFAWQWENVLAIFEDRGL